MLSKLCESIMEATHATKPVVIEVEKTFPSSLENKQRDSSAKDANVYRSLEKDKINQSRTDEVFKADSRHEKYSKLKSLLQAPVKTPMASVATPSVPTVGPPPAQIEAPSSTTILVPPSGPSGAPLLTSTAPRQSVEDAVVSPTKEYHNERSSSQQKKDADNFKWHHEHCNDDVNVKRDLQLLPLDLSCKNPHQRTVTKTDREQAQLQQQRELPQQTGREDCIQNGHTIYDDTTNRRSPRSPNGFAELNLSPVTGENERIHKPVQASAPFDPLLILSQVACEKLSELQSSEPQVKVKGRGRQKRNKKGHNGKSRKSKKKNADKTIESDNITIERIENGKPADATSYVENHSGQTKQNGYHNQYAKYRGQTGSEVEVKMKSSHYGSNSSGVQTGDYMELTSGISKDVGTVNIGNQGDGKTTDRSTWPYTCKTCGTRFKNAAFLKIHTKIAHENKMARSDAAGNRIKFVSKGGASSPPESPADSATPTRPFPIPHWKSSSSSNDAQTGGQNHQGYTSIPCVLKVHRQTSTSEMSSSMVKMEGDLIGMEDGKFEPADIFRAAENGEFDSHHPRPKLEVDGSSYEIIKVERDKSASVSEEAMQSSPSSSSSPGSGKGYQHKFYLQISERNQSGTDSTAVKIESGTTRIPLEGFDDVDDKSELKRKLFEGNPNQIRVPTSLALKFIPGDSSDPQRQQGYQHKVYLRIVDGSDSSIRIKTGSMKSQSSTIVGSTAVKIESTYLGERSCLNNVHDTSRPHKCHYCTKYFPSISALTAHERIHTGEKPYECRFCGRAFYHQNDRRKHERIHTGEKPYQCSICGQKFTNKGQVKIHERNHTGERPYQCRHCHKCFKSISNVNRHEKIHTGLKPFTCPVCHRGFSRREHVRTHEEICRKKLIEDEAELADDPIGDVKLPYYRKIGGTVKPELETPSPVAGSPPFSDQRQPPEKRPKFDEDDSRESHQDRDQWLPEQGQNDDDVNRANAYRRSDEVIPSTSESEDSDNISPLLYNSGPPVKTKEVASTSSGFNDTPRQSDDVIATSGNIAEDVSKETASVETDPSNGYKYKSAGGDGFLPIGYDQNKPPIHMSYEPNDNRAKIPPPVLYVPGSGDRNSTDSRFVNDKPPLLYVSVPTRSPVPPPTVMAKRKPDPSKLSTYIESLEPLPEQTARYEPETGKKEPRHYICGQTKITSVIQDETVTPTKQIVTEASHVKLSECIPESDRLSIPTIQRSSTLPVNEMYSNTAKRQEPVSILMKTNSAGGNTLGGESPPVLCPQNISSVSKLFKPALDEPPILSVIEEGPSKGSESPINAIPPLLERNDRLFVETKQKEISNVDAKNIEVVPSASMVNEGIADTRTNERNVFDNIKGNMADISQPFSIVHIPDKVISSNQS